MAGPMDSDYGICDAFTDPYCDLCFEIKGLNIKVSGFCRECVQFLCSDCHAVHGKLQFCRHHEFIQGEDMPKSQDDKPPRFDFCDVHPKLLKDEFCFDHRSLLCPTCATFEHKRCCIKSVKVACTTVDVSETSALYDRIQSLQDTLKSSLASVEKELKKLKDQEKSVLQDVQQVYDQITAKVNKLFGIIKNEIQTSCQSQIDRLSRHQKKVNDIILRLDLLISDVGGMKAKPIDTKIFLSLQETVNYTTKFTVEFQESRKSLQAAELSFVPSKTVGEILSSLTFGTISKSESKFPDHGVLIPKILFPVSDLNQIAARSKSEQRADAQNLEGTAAKPLVSKMSRMKAIKNDLYYIRQEDDRYICSITGMTITYDKRILMADKGNRKVKVFSHDMKFLSSVSVPDTPQDIAVVSAREAVVTTGNKSLVILDISGSQLSIKTITQLSYNVLGISRYDNKLVVTSPGSKPQSVKLIDQTGTVYWSVSSDQQGKPLFRSVWYVSSRGGGRSSAVMVTDQGNYTLTFLNGYTGEVIHRRQLKEGNVPRGVTTDSDGNVYVCYWWKCEVAVLPKDLSEETILLTGKNDLSNLRGHVLIKNQAKVCDGLSSYPETIIFDDEAHQLIVSYDDLFLGGYDYISLYQLS